MKKPLYDYLNSPLSLLVFGFVLTTLVGTFINQSFHTEAWKSKARFEIFKERLKEATEAQSSIIVLSNRRITMLERMYSQLQDNRLQVARDIWKEYFQIVREWNNNVKSNSNRLALLFGDRVSDSFLDNDENSEDMPRSLHHVFRRAHEAVLEVIECMKAECKSSLRETLLIEARKRLDTLGRAHDDFAMQLRNGLRQKEKQLLK